MISLIVAMDLNNLIGSDGDMPWNLPEDLKYFKEKTLGKKIIMGSNTFKSIGKALPGRDNYVLTRDSLFNAEDVTVLNSFDEVLALEYDNPKEEIMIIGGGVIYKHMLKYADRLYITLIEETFYGDTYFPIVHKDEWIECLRTEGNVDGMYPFDFNFMQYSRV